MSKPNKTHSLLLFVLFFGIVSCSSDDSNKNSIAEEIDYKLRIHKSGQEAVLRSSDIRRIDAIDRILFYNGGNPFPKMSDKEVDQFENPNIRYVEVETSCLLNNKEIYNRFQISSSRFYFYQVIPKKLLLWPFSRVTCDFVFHPSFHSGSTNPVQKTYEINLAKSVVKKAKNSKQEAIEMGFSSLNLDTEKSFCLSAGNEVISPLSEDDLTNFLSCRYFQSENEKVFLSKLYLNPKAPVLDIRFHSSQATIGNQEAISLSIKNQSDNQIDLKIPPQVGEIRKHTAPRNVNLRGRIKTTFTYKAEVIGGNHLVENHGEYFFISLKPKETADLRLGSHCVHGFETFENSLIMKGLDVKLSQNWLNIRFDGQNSDQYYPFHIPVNGINMQELRQRHNSKLMPGKYHVNIRTNQNCQFVR